MTSRALALLPDLARAVDYSASAAKAKFSELIDIVAAGGVATITRRGRQRFAVLKLETVENLLTQAGNQELESLGGRYDELVAKMQTEESKAAVRSLFTADTADFAATFAPVPRSIKPKR